ncbi:MAG: UvrD-helicase domain-containing protein [Acidobacteriota bacterium]
MIEEFDPTDPSISVAVRASAGTGKTFLLARRYLRLIQAGVPPRRILTLTFTRKAAGEMRERILRLAKDPVILSPPAAQALLDHFEDIAISTIDSFCQGLLREFPLEAEVDPAFEILDTAVVERLRGEVAEEVAHDAVRRSSPLAMMLGESRLARGLSTLLARRHVLEEPLYRYTGGLGSVPTPGEILAQAAATALEIVGGENGWSRLVGLGPKDDAVFEHVCGEVNRLLRGANPRLPALNLFFGLFLPKRDRAAPAYRGYPTAAFSSRAAYEAYRQAVMDAAPDAEALRRDVRVRLNRALAMELRGIYTRAKAQFASAKADAGGMDFEDVLDLVIKMLRTMPEFALTRFHLESRYQHLLVDEFQDTNQHQWAVIEGLTEPWRHGDGIVSEGRRPTIMIVGDGKQSIYGFRSADVSVFRRAVSHICEIDPARPGKVATLRRSHRATPRVLSFVNDLFGAMPKAGSEYDFAFAYDEEDRFPIDAPCARGEIAICVEGSADMCADAIAAEICRLLDRGVVIERKAGQAVERRFGPADAAILFRSRTGYQVYETALKRAGLPTYVYRGLGFYDRPEIRDVDALIGYLADPESDLAAACLLRSRLARVSDTGILRIGRECGGGFARFLRGSQQMDLSVDDMLALRCLRESLPRWLQATDRVPPVELIESILGETFYGAELDSLQAREDLKKLLNILRRLQNRGYMTMSRLAGRLEEESQVEEASAVLESIDAVNMMTIHAAKGLEFNAVFVVNIAGRKRQADAGPRIYRPGGDHMPAVEVVEGGVYEVPAAVKERDIEDEKRLLYVALTRASERICISTPCDPDGRIPDRGFFSLLPESFRATMQAAASSKDAAVHWAAGDGASHQLAVLRAPAEHPRWLGAEPRWLGAEPPEVMLYDSEPASLGTSRQRRSVSEAVRGEPPGPTGGRRAEVAEVGRIVHKLMEHRVSVDETLIDRASSLVRPEIPVYEIEEIAKKAADLYATLAQRADLRQTLASGECLREVPFVIAEQSGSLVRGVVDCVVRRDEGTIVIDYKTGRRTEADVDQMRVYLQALRLLMGQATRLTGMLFYATGEPVIVLE